MRLQQVTNEDGRMCAQLLNLISKGRWDLSGADAEALVATRRWVQTLASQMAAQLKSPPQSAEPAPAAGGMRIKKMPQPATSSSKSRKK
jgi:hypothetical protein